jgi:CHAT domain-containing protein
MKLSAVLLLFLFGINLIEINAPRHPAGVATIVWQAGLGTTPKPAKPVTVEERKRVLEELEESVRLALGEGQTLEAARNLNRIGGLHLLLNDAPAALASHLQALDLLRQSPDAKVEIDNLNGSAAAYLSLPPNAAPNSPDYVALAQSALDKAIALSKNVHYTLGEAQALLTLSELQNRSKYATAVLTAQEALALWKSRGDKEGLARTYHQIGTCYLAQNLLTEAIENFSQALELWRGLKDRSQEAATLISLGFAEFRKAEWQACIRYLTGAYPLLDERAEPVQMGRMASTLGASFIETGSPEMGVAQYQRALDYYRQANDYEGISYATWGLGRAYFFAGDLDQATIYFQQALEPIEKNSVSAAPILEYLGRIHIGRGEYAVAQNYLGSVLTIYTEAGNLKEAARVLALLGQAYDRQGMLSRAKLHYQEALETFTRLSDRVNQAAIYYALGELEMKQRNYDAASGYLRQSIDVTEGMRRVSTSYDLMAAFSASVQERYEAYIECLMKQHEKQPAGEFAINAFETSELGRARTLSELLLALQTNLTPGADPQLAARQRSLRQTLRIKENDRIKLLAQTDTREQLIALEQETARLEAEYKKVNDTIRSRFPSYDEISRPTAWDLRQIQEKILADDDAVLVEYTLGTENSYAWTITRNSFTSHKLPPKKIINAAVQRVYALLSNPPQDGNETELARASAELSKLVLAPVASSLNRQRIILVADGALNYIPFQLLPNPSGNNEPMVAGYEVINAPSASILGQLRQEKQHRRPTRVLAAFGDPVFASNYAQFKDSATGDLAASVKTSASRDVEVSADSLDPSVIQPLNYTKFELKNLSEIAGPESFIAKGFTASRETLGRIDLSEFSILHFATHGVLVPEKPELSGFFLSTVDTAGRAQDGFISMQDVYRLNAPVDLVVLSACRTGLGKDMRGEGLIGLTRGFMYAGASSVVASLWKVDDEATGELMKHFYANMLKKGMRPADALRAAQNTLRQDPNWQAPHFWAGFTLQGEFKEPIRVPVRVPAATRTASPFVQKMVGAGLLMALLAGIGWGYWRRRGPQTVN